jgi:Cellulose biosynthesis protein BcsS
MFLQFVGYAALLGWQGGVRADSPDPIRRYEISTGAELAANSMSIYSVMTASLAGDISRDGVRLRAGGGYGTYSYSGARWNGVARTEMQFDGRNSWADILAGYQASIGPWTIKAFVGGAFERHTIAPFDDENLIQGEVVGVKAALETWLRLGDVAFLQTDASWSQPFEAYNVRSRLGYRVTPTISVGLDAAMMGNAAYDSGRGGVFARYEWSGGEASVSAGAAGDRDGVDGSYGALSILFRF